MWVASLISTLIFNLDLGLLVAVVFSLLTLLYRTQRSVNIIFDAINTLLYGAASPDITDTVFCYLSSAHAGLLTIEFLTRPCCHNNISSVVPITKISHHFNTQLHPPTDLFLVVISKASFTSRLQTIPGKSVHSNV